jgi:hypothetical protein
MGYVHPSVFVFSSEEKNRRLATKPSKGVELVCCECDKTFTRKAVNPARPPRCPNCGSHDIDVGA